MTTAHVSHVLKEFDLLTEAQAAELCGKSLDRLRRDRWAGVGPVCVKQSRRVLYRRADLESYIEKQRVDPEAGDR